MSDRAVIKGHSIHRTVRINASRAIVWDALTEPDQISQWFGEKTELPSLAVGTAGVFEWEGFGSFPFEVTEVVEREVFAYRWSGEPRDELDPVDSTIVRFTLADDGDATLLSVEESGFENIAGKTVYRRMRLEQNREGWNLELDELAAFLES